MSAGFTPGPWGVEDPMGPDTLTIVGNPSEEAYNWLWVATVALDDETDGGGAFIQREEAEANARLIASAPALYAKLDAICREFAQGHPLIVEGIAALAQARGDLVDPLEQVRS